MPLRHKENTTAAEKFIRLAIMMENLSFSDKSEEHEFEHVDSQNEDDVFVQQEHGTIENTEQNPCTPVFTPRHLLVSKFLSQNNVSNFSQNHVSNLNPGQNVPGHKVPKLVNI